MIMPSIRFNGQSLDFKVLFEPIYTSLPMLLVDTFSPEAVPSTQHLSLLLSTINQPINQS